MALTTTLVSVCQDLMAETVRTTLKTANPILAITTPDVRMLSMTIAVFVYQVSEHDCTYCTALDLVVEHNSRLGLILEEKICQCYNNGVLHSRAIVKVLYRI